MRAEIATKQAKFTLEQLHAELAGKILDNKKEADRLRQSLLHVEAVLKLLDPKHNLRRIAIRRRKPNQWFKRGTIWRAALDVLRQAKSPLSVSELAAHMLAAKGIADPPRSAVEQLEGAVRAAMRYQEGGTVVAVKGEQAVEWTLKTGPD